MPPEERLPLPLVSLLVMPELLPCGDDGSQPPRAWPAACGAGRPPAPRWTVLPGLPGPDGAMVCPCAAPACEEPPCEELPCARPACGGPPCGRPACGGLPCAALPSE